MMWDIFQPSRKNCFGGFTLSELLISLSILGLIGALAIPKVIQSTQESQKRTLMRNAIRVLSETSLKLTNEPPALIAPNNTSWHAFDTVLNSADDNFDAVGSQDNSFTMPGGVVVSSFNFPASDGLEGILLDANGTAQPNVIGQDRVFITTCYNPMGTCLPQANRTVGNVEQEAGVVGPTPDANVGAGNVAFYDKIMTTK